jgi:hypothetical protein
MCECACLCVCVCPRAPFPSCTWRCVCVCVSVCAPQGPFSKAHLQMLLSAGVLTGGALVEHAQRGPVALSAVLSVAGEPPPARPPQRPPLARPP